MTQLEKKEQLVKKLQQIPERYYDDVNTLFDTILKDQEAYRREHFEQLLIETSEKYKVVWKALA